MGHVGTLLQCPVRGYHLLCLQVYFTVLTTCFSATYSPLRIKYYILSSCCFNMACPLDCYSDAAVLPHHTTYDHASPPSTCLQAATDAALGLPPLQRDTGLLRMCHVLAELCKLACKWQPPAAKPCPHLVKGGWRRTGFSHMTWPCLQSRR